MYILCRDREDCATTSEHIKDCVAASENISVFFNERAAASEKKKCATASERKCAAAS